MALKCESCGEVHEEPICDFCNRSPQDYRLLLANADASCMICDDCAIKLERRTRQIYTRMLMSTEPDLTKPN